MSEKILKAGTSGTELAIKMEALPWPSAKDELWRYSDPEKYQSLLTATENGFQGELRSENIEKLLNAIPQAPNRLVFYNGEYQNSLSILSSDVRFSFSPHQLGDARASSESFAHSEKFWTSKIKSLTERSIQKLPILTVGGGSNNEIVRMTVLNVVDSKVTSAATGQNKTFHSTRIEVSQSAQVQLFIHHVSLRSLEGVSINDIELECGPNSQVSVVETGDLSDKDNILNFLNMVISADAKLNYNGFLSSGKNLRHETCVQLAGANAEIHYASLTVGQQGQVIDNLTRIIHSVGNTTSSQLVKNVVHDHGKVSFTGQLRIELDAQKSDANQYCHSLILGEAAEANSKPQLEVLADDVKAAHGATVGQLSLDEIFYLQSRAISREDAEHILSNSFQNEIVDKIDDPSARSFVRTHLSRSQH